MNTRGDSALVTGGAGFIGAHLVERLLSAGVEVRVLDDLSTGMKANLSPVVSEVEFIEGDIRDPRICAEASRGVRWVFHQAALGSVPRSVNDPITSNDVNLGGTLNMLRAAQQAGCERFVFAASSSAYGNTPTLPKIETMRPRPLSPYAASKLACEHYCSAFWHSYGLPTIVLRYFNIFGPRQRPDGPYAAVIPRFFEEFETGGQPVIFGDGEQTRDFTYVDNAVDANILAVRSSEPAFGQVFNIASGARTSINQLVGLIAQLVGVDADPNYTDPRAGDVRDSLADVDKAQELLGYEPNVMLAEGLKRTWASFRG